MKLCLDWLKDYVEIDDLTAAEIAKKLTMTGSKVETITTDGGKIKNIVVGKILTIEQHKNAENLVICNVLIGEKKTVKIITAAKNVTVSSMVAVCLNNSCLFDGTIIKHQKLRGVLSEGMLCSLKELGLYKEHFPYADENGIFLIKEKCEVGQDIKDALDLNDDILSFEITSNRPDCLSVLGLAREVAVAFSKSLKKPKLFSINSFNTTKNKNEIAVFIKTNLCKRYMAQLIEDVAIKPSPLFVRNRLRKMGIKPINNIVDITNYVMLEFGVPIHAFDAEKIENSEITIKTAEEDEKIETLDGLTHSLKKDDIVICNKNKNIALAGIIGAVESAITNKTKKVIIEVACFDGDFIRKTSKRLKIKTESAMRFEKGLNPTACEETMKRACELIVNLSAGKIVTPFVDFKNFDETTITQKLELNTDYINKFLGINLKEKEMENILLSLGFVVKNKKITIPNFRIDIKNIADIAEEIARIYGYEKIISKMPVSSSSEIGLTKEQILEKDIKNIATALGLFEIYSFSIVNPKIYEKLGFNQEEFLKNTIFITNPFSEEKSLMRKDLTPSMLEVLSYNFRNKNKQATLFEIGKTYEKFNNEIIEKKWIVIGIYNNLDFFGLKGLISTLLKKIGILNFEFKKAKQKPFNPFVCCEIIKNNNVLGVFGEIRPNVCENFKIAKKTYIAKLDFCNIFNNIQPKRKYSNISKFPAITRDISLVCDENLEFALIEDKFSKNLKNILEKIEVFDIYRGKQIESNKKSISLKLTMRAKEKTLTDKDINKKINFVLKELTKIGVELRKI